MKIGQKLKEQRTEAGLSQESLAQQLGVSRQTVSSWENDRSYPDIGSILKLSDLYGISLDEMLKEDENMRKHVEQTSAFHEQMWTYLFMLTIMLIPLAIVLEQCLKAFTAARILTIAAMVILPFLINARYKIMGEDKVINAILVVVWIAIGISGAHFLVFGWILIYYIMLNKKGASFWLALVLYFAVPISIVIGQYLPQFLEEGIHQQPPKLFGQTYRLESKSDDNDLGDYSMLELVENGNRLVLDGMDMGYMEFEEAETGSSEWGNWYLIPNEDCPLESCTIEVDRYFDPQIKFRTSDGQQWNRGTLHPIPKAIIELRTDQGEHFLKMDWYSIELIPEQQDQIRSVQLTEQGSAAIILDQKASEEAATKLVVLEEYYYAGRMETRRYTLIPDENGTFPFPEVLEKRYDGAGQFAVYTIAWDGGEYLFRIDFA